MSATIGRRSAVLELLDARFFAVCLAVLLVFYGYHNLCDAESIAWQVDSENLVIRALDFYVNNNYSVGGLLHLMPNTDQNPSNYPTVYRSQFGLQFYLFRSLVPDGHLESVLSVFRVAIGSLLALAIAVYLLTIKRMFGLPSGLFCLVFILGSNWLTKYSGNLYWMTFSFFLPFVFSLSFFESFYNKNKTNIFYMVFAFLIFLKALFGYEYLTNVVFAGLVPLALHRRKLALSKGKVVVICFTAFFAACFGFALAFAAHAAKDLRNLGDWSTVDFVLRRAGMRMMLTREGVDHIFADFRAGWNGLAVVLDALRTYFLIRGNRNAVLFTLPQLSVIGLGLIPILYAKLKAPSTRGDGTAPMLVAAFLASISWGIFAFNHAVSHAGMNLFLWHLPFNLLFAPYIGRYLAYLLIDTGELPRKKINAYGL